MKKGMIIAGSSILVVGILVICAILFTKDNSDNLAERDTHITVEAKVDEYQFLEEIEEKSDIIVKVEKKSEEPPMVERGNRGNVNFSGTIGNVEVKEIFKNESGRNIEIGSILPVFENEAYDASGKVTYHVANYKKMALGKEYMLFLYYSESDEWYVPLSAIWGKYPLDSSESVLFNDSKSKLFMATPAKVVDELEQIGVEIRKKYD